MEFIRFVYKTHGFSAIVIAVAGILHLGFFLAPSHSLSHWATWVAFVCFGLSVLWFQIGYGVFKQQKVSV